MNLFSRLLAAVGGDTDKQRLSPDDPRAWGGGPEMTASGVAVTRDKALGLDVVQAILEVLGSTISTLPLKVVRDKDGGTEAATDHPLYSVLHHKPNASQSKQEFVDELVRHLAYDRNAYARIVAGFGPVEGLELINPTRILRVEEYAGRRYYLVRGLGASPAFTLRDDEIWHIRKAPLNVDGSRAVPIYESAREVFGRAIAVEEYGARWFANSGQSGGLVRHPGTFKTKEDENVFMERWRALSTGANRHRDRLLLFGADYTPNNTVQNDQAQFLETIKQMETKICGLWQMPPHRVGRLERATNNNIEQQGLEFVVYTLAPWVQGIEQSATSQLIVDAEASGVRVEFNVDGLLRGDLAARYRAYALGRQWGWLTINDILKRENMPTIGGEGDVRITPLNMVPAGTIPADDGNGKSKGQEDDA